MRGIAANGDLAIIIEKINMVEAASSQLWTDKQKADSEVERPWVVILPQPMPMKGRREIRGKMESNSRFKRGNYIYCCYYFMLMIMSQEESIFLCRSWNDALGELDLTYNSKKQNS